MHTCKRRLFSLILILPLATFAVMPHGFADSGRPALPVRAPVPQAAPAPELSPAAEVQATGQAAIPTPRPRPPAAQRPERPMFGPPMPETPLHAEAVPAAVPVPTVRPGRAPGNPSTGEMLGPPAPKMLPDKRSNAERPATMPTDETACRARLKLLGAEFEEAAPQSNADGCALPFPLKLKRLAASIDIAPDAVINCAAAEASARFATNVISPAAKAEFGEELATVGQASAYVCRPRNGTRKLSEHAFGNALDISRFTLTKGTAIDVEPAPPAKNAKFLSQIRKAACGPFKTVLGPGSDADHALHFHFDLAPRRNGGTFCQ